MGRISESKVDDSELLETLSEPDVETEEDEDLFKETPIRENFEFTEENENEDYDLSEFGDMSPEDYETLKNLMEKEAEEDDEEVNLSEDDEEESEEVDLENTFEPEAEREPEETDETSEIMIDEEPDNQVEQKLSGEETKKEDEKFDIDDTIFKGPEDEEKVDWSWGDELNEVAEEDTSPIEEQSEKEQFIEKQEIEQEEETDPFGTLEKTLESDDEFKMLTGEYDYQPEDEVPVDEEIRVTNLDRPRPVPPKPTRLTRLTQDEVAEDETSAKTKEETPGYRSYRESTSRSNIFVIGGIIVILIAIIYFAFSIGSDGDAGKEVIKPTYTETESSGDQPIVSDKPSSTNTQAESAGQTDVSQPRADRGSSDVEEVRVSNLIFRRGNEFNVQVSSWRSSLKANDEVKRLRAQGYDAFSVQAYLPSKGGTWHRVRIGGFKSIDEARNFLNTSQF